MTIKSPLTGGTATHLRTLSRDYVVDLYRSSLDFDLRPFFDADEISLYRCDDTGYEFFESGGAAGSPEFYEALYANADWAYQDSKWEYGIAAGFVRTGDSVLDVGSGAGQFLATLSAANRTGLETNKAGRDATPEGVAVFDETVETHAGARSGCYDVVTAIQVLEHVYDVRSFIESCRVLLRPGGTLVLSVPNNDGFVGVQELPLNMPPHHMGRWTRRSLSAIASLSDLELVRVESEPLQEKNVNWYKSWMEKTYLPRSRIARSAYHRLGISGGLRHWLRENRTSISGHTILAAYRKPDDRDEAA